MKFRFATVNASKFRLPSRKNACNFSDRGKTRGRQRTETIARVVDRVGRGGWKRISIFICVGRFAIRFKPPRTLPPSSCIAIRIYSKSSESNYRPTRQIWVSAYGTSIARNLQCPSNENHSSSSNLWRDSFQASMCNRQS